MSICEDREGSAHPIDCTCDVCEPPMPVHGSSLSVADLRAKLSEALAENERLHTAICQAVHSLNIGAILEAHTLLRQALIDHADAALAQSDRGRG